MRNFEIVKNDGSTIYVNLMPVEGESNTSPHMFVNMSEGFIYENIYDNERDALNELGACHKINLFYSYKEITPELDKALEDTKEIEKREEFFKLINLVDNSCIHNYIPDFPIECGNNCPECWCKAIQDAILYKKINEGEYV